MGKVLIGNFKGPKGDKGDQGATGPKGEQGIQGNTGPAGGVDSVSTPWTNGMQGDVVLDPGPQMHRNLFRGKDLGSTLTDEQKAAIAAGTWDDLYLGDYWQTTNNIWRIVDFDYWLRKGGAYPGCTQHHLVIMPDFNIKDNDNPTGILYQFKITDSGTTEPENNTTVSGYAYSDMHTVNMPKIKELIEKEFAAGMILNHKDYFVNGVTNGVGTSAAMFDSEVEIPCEAMITGSSFCTPRGNGTTVFRGDVMDTQQLALFQVNPYYYYDVYRQGYWLRDIASNTCVGFVNYQGDISPNAVTYPTYVRPVFGIVGN